MYAYEPFGSWRTLLQYFPSLTDLYLVWESLLLCESVIVFAKSPQTCSECVTAVNDMIRPVPFSGVCRPYMTMQSDFRCIGLDGGSPKPFLVGVTNPFLLGRILDATEKNGQAKPYILYLHDAEDNIPIKRNRSQYHHTQAGIDLPGWIDYQLSKKRHIKADKEFLQHLAAILKDQKSSEDEPGQLIRRHFAELSAQFVSPFNRYLATSISLSIAPTGGTIQYANFSQAAFIESLSKYGTSVKLKGQTPLQRHRLRDALYESFCQSPNFHSWLVMKGTLEKEASAGLLGGS